MLSFQKSSYDKTGLGYTSEGSSSSEPKKKVRFVSTKNLEKPKVEKLEIKTPAIAKKTISAKPKDRGNHYPKVKKNLK